jgi:pimeloyl-ACP methyl ester carboxylesterase
MQQQAITFHDEGSGFPIVWIHGFPLSSAVFTPQTRIQGYRHIRPDLRGFGATPPPDGEMTMAGYARDVVDVLDRAGVDRAVVAGLSMGGYVAMQMLRDAPARVAALLLLDTHEKPDSEEERAGRYKSAEDVAKNGTINVVEAMLPKMVVREPLRIVVRHIMNSATPAGVIAALKAMAERADSTATLRDANVPALVIVGEHDAITPVADAERMVSLMKAAELAPIANAAHLANFEASAQVNDLIPAFLARYLETDKAAPAKKRR